MKGRLGDPLWWRYRLGNPLLAGLPLHWQYGCAELWGRWRANAALDAEAIRRGVTMLLGRCDTERDETIVRAYHGLQSRIRLDDHRMATATMSDVVGQVTLRDADILTRAAAQGRGLIILTAHYGRLGMIGPALRRLGLSSAFLSATVDERATALSPMQRWVGYRNGQSLQRFAGGQWIMADDPTVRLRSVLRRGEPLIIVMDAFSSHSPQRETYRFGAGTLSIPTGIVRLAQATGALFALALLHDVGGPRVEMRCSDLAGSPREALQQAFDIVAQAVWTEPWQWWLLPHAATLWQPLGPTRSAWPDAATTNRRHAT
ncbi:hypothetical protein Tther_01877 [Tepidimonas thermarum]|uniref:Uncharacterized protein n=1 Tax=Tepidimonas thermarum TaxID=335431 RepID=A0A554WYV1_9BURK|nr:hypothetical protein [Tepidimonas thermarum]TSE28751.1 hypothetical protein Tther_01877 [Tepidimonas thermarum]